MCVSFVKVFEAPPLPPPPTIPMYAALASLLKYYLCELFFSFIVIAM